MNPSLTCGCQVVQIDEVVSESQTVNEQEEKDAGKDLKKKGEKIRRVEKFDDNQTRKGQVLEMDLYKRGDEKATTFIKTAEWKHYGAKTEINLEEILALERCKGLEWLARWKGEANGLKDASREPQGVAYF